MNKRAKSKVHSRNVRPRLSKTTVLEDEKYLQNEPDMPGVSVAETKCRKNVGSQVSGRKRQKEKSNKQKVYEISDSSDEDFVENVIADIASSLNDNFQPPKSTRISNSLPSGSEMTSDTTDFVNNLLKTKKHTRISNSTPSTSNITFDTTDFVDDLLNTNKELLNGSFVKSYEELCKETDQLLASTLELFNDNSTNSKDSAVYVCADKNSMKSSAQEIKSSAQENFTSIKSASEVSGHKPGQTCPICLETLGGELTAWSTFCGHVFCKHCIENWITSQKNCPTCRKRLTKKKIHQLFLNC